VVLVARPEMNVEVFVLLMLTVVGEVMLDDVE
jgi:hypothetical protein